MGQQQGTGISGSTRLVGLIGWPVVHSLSPAIHNAAAAALGVDLVYVPLPVRPGQLPQAVRGLPALGFLGANITVPHKETIMPLLDEIDPAARAIGAVNTIVISERESGNNLPAFEPGTQGDNPEPTEKHPRLIGYNTDWKGFMDDLSHQGVIVKERQCWVLGAGGSARAVAYGLAGGGGLVTVFARRVEQARALVADLGPKRTVAHISALPWYALEEQADKEGPALIVNTTPIGMAPDDHRSPWPEGTPLPPGSFVYDLVYNPRESMLIRQANSSGAIAVGGLGMLLRQGAASFQMWTGLKADPDVMKGAINMDKT